MINFKNCIITGNSLYIDVRVKPHVYFENCYINRVVVNDVRSFHTTGPNLDDYVYDSGELDGDHKKFMKLITNGQFHKPMKKNISDNIYFIYVQIKGIPSIDTPCGYDVEWYSIAIIDYQYIYNRAISYIRDLTDRRCSRPEDFVDFILRFKALEMCIISKDWERAILYFKKYFEEKESHSQGLPSSGCRSSCCHG